MAIHKYLGGIRVYSEVEEKCGVRGHEVGCELAYSQPGYFRTLTLIVHALLLLLLLLGLLKSLGTYAARSLAPDST